MMHRLGLVALFVFLDLVTAAGAVAGVQHPAAPRLLYTGDWSGSTEVYSVDPAHAGSVAQITFGHDGSCDPLADACGFANDVPSPDGRHVAFETGGLCGSGYFYATSGYLFVAGADGHAQRRLGPVAGYCSQEVAWAPDSRHLAFTTLRSIHVARADGSHDRTLANGSRLAWAPDSHRLAYVDATGIHVAGTDGSNDHLLYRRGSIERLAWSGDGRALAFVSKRSYCAVPVVSGSCPPGQTFLDPSSGDLSVISAGSHAKAVSISDSVDEFAWSPNRRWLAYSTYPPGAHVVVVRPDGSGRRQVSADYTLAISWSGDGRHFAFIGEGSVHVIDAVTGSDRLLGGHVGYDLAWSPKGRLLAFDRGDGISVYSVASGATSLLSRDHEDELAWAPDGRSVAYVSGDLRVVTLGGAARTVVAAAGRFGGYIKSIAWTRPPARLRYRAAVGRSIARVGTDQLDAPWPIERIAADGSHVLYVTCGHMFVWTPATGDVVQAESVASLTPRCTTVKNYVPFDIYDVALADARIAFGIRSGNMSQGWDLFQQPLAGPSGVQPVDDAYGYADCTVGDAGLGDLVGAGDLLVFSRWHEFTQHGDCGPILSQQIFRLDAAGCPCPEIATSPGPLLPADVEGNRVVAVGTNATEVLSSTGARLLDVPVHALAAQLSGFDLLVVVQGQLRDYDAVTGALVHAWPLPDVPSGGPCGSPHPWGCPPLRLELEDAARGLAAHVLDGEVHVIRLADGADTTIAKGATARFLDAGLVYADGASLHLVPFGRLPLR